MHSFHQQCKECVSHCATKLYCSGLSNEQLCTIKAMDNLGFINEGYFELPAQATLLSAWVQIGQGRVHATRADTVETYRERVAIALQCMFKLDMSAIFDEQCLTGEQDADLNYICKVVINALALPVNKSKVLAAMTRVHHGRSDAIHELKCTINTLTSFDNKETIAELMQTSVSVALLSARPVEVVGDWAIALAVTLQRLGALSADAIMISPVEHDTPLTLLNAVMPVIVDGTVAFGTYAVKRGKITTYHPGLYEMLEYVLGDVDKQLCGVGDDISHFIDSYSATSALCQILLDKVLRTMPKTPLTDDLRQAVLSDVEPVAEYYGKTKEFAVFAASL